VGMTGNGGMPALASVVIPSKARSSTIPLVPRNADCFAKSIFPSVLSCFYGTSRIR
jgi:hypothetical protein